MISRGIKRKEGREGRQVAKKADWPSVLQMSSIPNILNKFQFKKEKYTHWTLR